MRPLQYLEYLEYLSVPINSSIHVAPQDEDSRSKAEAALRRSQLLSADPDVLYSSYRRITVVDKVFSLLRARFHLTLWASKIQLIMANNSIGFQISLELANILPIRNIVSAVTTATWSTVLNLARNLKRSGSDLLVEEDLCNVFGRVTIDHTLSKTFLVEILKDTKLVELPNKNIELSAGAGPTLNRAIERYRLEIPDESLLATFIQLALLSWTQERLSLASSLHHALNKRVEIGLGRVHGINASPGQSSLADTLDACSSQSSSFPWNQYLVAVKERMPFLWEMNDTIALPTNLLIACLDGLPIMQRMPDDYTLRVSERGGCITLVIWAHHMLGLSVLVKGPTPEQDIIFAHKHHNGPAHIVIDGTKSSFRGPEVCLLYQGTEIYLRIDPAEAEYVPVRSQERHSLLDYSTIMLCRSFNERLEAFDREDREPAVTDAMHFATAVALSFAKRAYRGGLSNVPCSIKEWQIWDAASVLFGGRIKEHDINTIRGFADTIPLDRPLNSLPPERLPSALRDYFADPQSSHGDASALWTAAVDIFVMSTISNIRSCEKLPIICDDSMDEVSSIRTKLVRWKASHIEMAANDFFSYVSWRMLGPDPSFGDQALEQGSVTVFMVSDFGWTLYLSTFGDNDGDPARINPERLFVFQGVPTNKKTGKRKFRARDATVSDLSWAITGQTYGKPTWTIDVPGATSGLYKPRCVSPVHTRNEFFGPATDAFHIIIRYRGEHLEPVLQDGRRHQFEVERAYRALHDNLWNTYRAPPCTHKDLHRSEWPQEHSLGIDVATAAGNWSWFIEEQNPRQKTKVLQRIVILLVKGDARARWLAVGVAFESKRLRHTMLRGFDCCEACAVQAAAAKEGKWFVII